MYVRHVVSPFIAAAIAGASCSRASVVGSPAPAADGADWPAYGRTLAGDRYSPLAEIDRTNVGRLHLQCSYSLPEVTSFQTGPIVVGGTMYFSTDTISYAIDASSCAEKWKKVR